MRLIYLAISLALSILSSQAYAQGSTINPNVPVQNSPLNSAPIRGNAQAAYNDINGILGMHGVSSIGSCPSAALIGEDCLVGTGPYTWYKWTGSWVLIGTIGSSSPFVVPISTPLKYSAGVLGLGIDSNFTVNGGGSLALANSPAGC